MTTTTKRRWLGNTVSYLLLFLTVAFFLLPLIWLIGTAFKPRLLSNCRQERHLCYVWDGGAIATIYEKRLFGG